MLDLVEEFRSLIRSLEKEKIAYAACGGMALAVHGIPRATLDIDILTTSEDLDGVKEALRNLGFQIEVSPMVLAQGSVTIHRMTKIDSQSGEVLPVDIVVTTPALLAVWKSRERVETEHGPLWVVSRDGLIEMKTLRNSVQDQADITRLREEF
jgi:hypothetical protein